MISALSTALSGLNASSLKLEAAASNIANSSTAGSLADSENAPYSAAEVKNQNIAGGVVSEITEKNPGFIPSFSPNSPFADENGYIGIPNVNLDEELINSQVAKYAYQANAHVIEVTGELFDTLIDSTS